MEEKKEEKPVKKEWHSPEFTNHGKVSEVTRDYGFGPEYVGCDDS